MARFKGTVLGTRGAHISEAIRLGHESLVTHAEADRVGVTVTGLPAFAGDSVEFRIYATGGSRGQTSRVYLGDVRLIDGKITFERADARGR